MEFFLKKFQNFVVPKTSAKTFTRMCSPCSSQRHPPTDHHTSTWLFPSPRSYMNTKKMCLVPLARKTKNIFWFPRTRCSLFGPTTHYLDLLFVARICIPLPEFFAHCSYPCLKLSKVSCNLSLFLGCFSGLPKSFMGFLGISLALLATSHWVF